MRRFVVLPCSHRYPHAGELRLIDQGKVSSTLVDSPQSPTVASKLGELSPAKRALLELRLKQQSRLSENERIVRRSPDKPARLSFAQELLWLQDQLTPGPAYNVPRALRLLGDLDVDALTATLRDIVARQDIFRTRFITEDGVPVQIVDEGITPPLEFIDLQALPEAEREAEATLLIKERANCPFDLSSDLLLRTSLFRLGPQDHTLLLVTHHIASDGWSRDVLFRELGELYDAHHTGRPAILPELPIQYADYAVWQRDAMEGYALKKQLDYWKRQLSGAPALLEMPIDYTRPAVQNSNGGRVQRHLLNSQELRELKTLGQQENATLFMTTLACAVAFLYRHTGQKDMVIGTPIAGRSRTETEHLLGYFTNTLALRAGVSGEMTFREVLRHVRQASLGAFEHQDLPYAKLVAELNPERTLAYNPVFQVLFGFGQTPPPPFALSDLISKPLLIERDMAKFDFTISTSEVAGGLAGAMEYKVDLFAHATIEQMMERLETLIKGIVAAPDAPLASLPILTEAERQKTLIEWNRTQTQYPVAANLPALFEAQVARTPDTVAVEFAGRKLTYAALNAKANQLAHCLRGLGVGPEIPVGILTERTDDRIVCLLGILKAGGAYVPLDENYPPERIRHILKTAEAPVVVTLAALKNNLVGYEGRIVQLDCDAHELAEQSAGNLAHTTGPENLAYVMFTSGSTGQPKGIAVPNSALTHFIRAATQIYGIVPTDRVLQFGSICFDTSIEEIFPCLTVGATLIVRDREMLDSLSTFWRKTRTLGITFLSLPTAFWHELARSAADQKGSLPDTLRLVVIGGEKAKTDRLELWRRFFGQKVQLMNTYGPTESTVVATACDITAIESGEIPIGRPLPNVRAYLLDEFNQPVPRGVVGELHIGGAGVARGYLHDPERTAAAFVPDPFTESGRLYKTGDLARYRPDGNIEFMGRRDEQLKLRGFRIELGEIENALAQHLDVGDVAVLAPIVEGEPRIIAYVSPLTQPGATELSVSALRAYLHERLPGYMVPHTFIPLPELPKTPGGKVDRRALPEPVWSESIGSEESQPPQTPLEETLANLWQTALGLNAVSVSANFFELGGHSLLAIRLLSDIKKEWGESLTLAEMLNAPTIRTMADLLERKQQGEADWEPLVTLQPHGDKLPLFCTPVGGGSAFYYRTLAEYIGDDQPLYLFEPIGMNGVDSPHETVEEMAAYYLKRLRVVQPHGPYSLCGLSLGGVVAFEMARRLTAAGEQIGTLLMFDTWAPGYPIITEQPLLQRVRRAGWKIRYKIGSYLENRAASGSMGDQLRYIGFRILRLPGKIWQRMTGKSKEAVYRNPASIELPEIFQKVRAAEAKARRNYRPPRYSGRIHLLRAHLQKPGLGYEPVLGWESLCSDVKVTPTPGTHFSMLEEPCIRVSIKHIVSALGGDEARRTQESNEPLAKKGRQELKGSA